MANAKIKESYIKCGHCGMKFRSPIFFADTDSFETATMMGNQAQCPQCGRMIHCNKENMSYVLADDEEPGGFVGYDFPDNKA